MGVVAIRAISFPFRVSGSRGIQSTDRYTEIVRGQVIDALMTNQGERVFRPRYGCDIQAALFDPRDELVRRDAAGLIQERLEQFVPRCIVRSVEIQLPDNSPVVFVNLVYAASPLGTDIALTVPISSSEFIGRGALPVSTSEAF